MRIVQLVMARQFRGAEIFASQLSSELVGLDRSEVTFVALYKSHGESFTPAVPFVDLEAEKGRVLNTSLLLKLRKVLRQVNPDVVQANAGDTLKYALIARCVFGFKYKVVFRNASTISKYITSSIQRYIYAFLYKKVDFICSVSSTSRADLLSVFPFCIHKIQVIPNAVKMVSVQKIDIFDLGYFNLLHVGGFTFEKNHAGLLTIFEKLLRLNPKVRLYMVGDGPLRPAIEALVIGKGLSASVFFLGTRSNVLDYIASANVLVLPSIIEGLPGVVLEAMCCRTPVVAFDVGGIGELVRDRQTGWLVPSGADDNFAESVNQVLHLHPDQRNLITGAAFSLVTTEYDSLRISREFLLVYQKVVEGNAI